MPISGPAMVRISSGSTSPIATPTRSATGSTSSRQAGSVASTHSARLQATAEPAPEGRAVTPSSHRSARRTASWTALRSLGPTLASFVPSALPWETAWRAMAVQDRSRAAARDQLKLAEERYRLGSGTVLEVSDALNAVTGADASYVNAVYDYHRAMVALFAVLGRRYNN